MKKSGQPQPTVYEYKYRYMQCDTDTRSYSLLLLLYTWKQEVTCAAVSLWGITLSSRCNLTMKASRLFPFNSSWLCFLSLSPATENAIQSFGYGSEEGALLVTEPSVTYLPPPQPPIISKPAPSLHGNAIKPMDSACMFSTCANLQVSSGTTALLTSS